MLNKLKKYKLDDCYILDVHTVISCKPLTGTRLQKKLKKDFNVFKIKDGQNGPDYVDNWGMFRECKVFQVHKLEHLQHNLLIWWDHYITTQEKQAINCMVLSNTSIMMFHIMFHNGPKATYIIGQLHMSTHD